MIWMADLAFRCSRILPTRRPFTAAQGSPMPQPMSNEGSRTILTKLSADTFGPAGTVRLTDRRLGSRRGGRVNAPDDNASRPDLRRPSALVHLADGGRDDPSPRAVMR